MFNPSPSVDFSSPPPGLTPRLAHSLLGSWGEGDPGCYPSVPITEAPWGPSRLCMFPECRLVPAAPTLGPGFLLWVSHCKVKNQN